MAISKCIPYTPVTFMLLMVLRLAEVMTCKSLHTVIIQISATRTVHRAATAIETALLDHFWQDRHISIQMK